MYVHKIEYTNSLLIILVKILNQKIFLDFGKINKLINKKTMAV